MTSAGFTLVELMVAITLGLLVLSALAIFSLYSAKSFAALDSYNELGGASQLALDKLSREIRQANSVTAYNTNSITILDSSGKKIKFIYNSANRTLGRVSQGITNVYLTNCDSLQFSIYQHTPISNSFDCYDTAVLANARLVQVTWNCSESILSTRHTTESVQSAKIAIRNH
jgi:prepilin-type N-terminal cleavage/methylation domain-containing protein